MKKCIPLVFIIFFSTSCSIQHETFELKTSSFLISIDQGGSLSSLVDRATGINYLSKDTTASLLSFKVDGELLNPTSASAKPEKNIFLLNYKKNIKAEILYTINEDYVKFDIISVEGNNKIELAVWGPYPTIINNTIGETIGVVQGEDFAIGLQALNAKTLGGYPWTDNDCMPQINIFSQDNFTDLSEEGKDHVLYRVEAAKPTKFGSTLQAYCRNRKEDRIVNNLQHEFYVSPKYNDGGIIHSQIAIFGCAKEKILPTIEKIELNEKLPHPMLEGEWSKIAKGAKRAYIIYAYSEDNIENAIKITEKAGLKNLYHPGPFKNWGHFDLRDELFPNGIKGLKKCVDIAREHGITLGLHTLSNFITTDDKYVTPIPDKRLAIVGSSFIKSDVNSRQKTIIIDDPKFFNQYENNSLKTVRINNELIRYSRVTEKSPWQLLDCKRGAFGTTPTKHNKGEKVSKLADHPYKVFLTNTDLGMEVSKNISELFNKTGVSFISFDGLEGNRSTGMGNYGEILFTLNWYNNLNNNIKKNLVTHASRTSHFFWHIYTRMNWGEPWYAGFRESQTEYRMKNQSYFKRNLMPGMLGWFQLKPETSIEDIEWMLSRSVAYNAGYALVVNDESISNNKQSDQILKLIGQWEKFRLDGLFTSEQQNKMKDINTEFELKNLEGNDWFLKEVYSYKFTHLKKSRQPGEPLYSNYNFENPTDNVELNFMITAIKCQIDNVVLEFDNYKRIEIPILLKENQVFKYNGGNSGIIYNSNWGKVKEIKISDSDITLTKGNHNVTFDCKMIGDNESLARFEVRLFGKNEKIMAKR